MYKPLLLIFLTIAVAMGFTFFFDLILVLTGTEEMRTVSNSAAEDLVINHLDWADLRTGDAPNIIKDITVASPVGFETRTYQETVERNLKKPALHSISRLQARTFVHKPGQPAYVGVASMTAAKSNFADLLEQERTNVIKREAIYIVESIHENYNY